MSSAINAHKALNDTTTETFEAPEVLVREQSVTDCLAKARELAALCNLSIPAARICVVRGIETLEQIRCFLNPSLRDQLPDPCGIKNVVCAAELLLAAVREKKRIVVYSDYDVDGLTSAAQLYLYLTALGANVGHYAPNRFTEGYGLVQSAVEALVDGGTELLVTVDCGISNIAEIGFARQAGVQTIVVDHHQPPAELPAAEVIVNPAQEGCSFAPHRLAAAGLVWMLLIVLRMRAKELFAEELKAETLTLPDPKDFLDLAALGTICDMVPLTGLNRLIALRGVEAINSSRRLGLLALRRVAGIPNEKPVTAAHIGFVLGPRLNAAGRVGNADAVFRLLTTGSDTEARSLAELVERANAERRQIEDRVLHSCLGVISANETLLQRPALALYGEDNHLGVIGIVAQRLVERHYRPVAVMGPGEVKLNGRTVRAVKGSVRGIPGIHIAQLLASAGHLLVSHGGHAEAGGFTVLFENLENFCEAFTAGSAEALQPAMLRRRLNADIELALADLDYRFATEVLRLAPFGVGNPSPLFVTRKVTVSSVSSIGTNHLRVRVGEGAHYANAVAWNFRGHPMLRKGERADIAYNLELSTYRGITSVQLNLRGVW